MNFASHVDTASRNAPSARAVGDREESLTFSELATRSNRLASALSARGVEPDDHVAIHAPNSVALVCTYLGILKCGAVAVPLNTRFSESQLEYVLSDSDVVCVVEHDDVGGELAAVDGAAVRYTDLLDDGKAGFRTRPRRAEQVAELLYTSGTTGAPKGVYHTHGNLQANARGYIECNEWSRSDVALTVCQCFHVTGLNITTTPFLALEAENHLLGSWDIEAVLGAIERYGVTYTFLIPTMVVELLDHDGVEEYDLSSLRIVGVGGSPMPKRRIEAVEQLLDCTLIEGYGMTETTPLATLNRPHPEGRKAGSVGQVAADSVEVRIEDLRTRETVETGERGELLWRGDTVTPRYNRSQLTKNVFVERDGKRWLKSGDVGWLDEDGFLFVVDRIEDMFTTGCGDVYPHEIEEVIYEIEPVQKVAIIDTTDDVRGTTVTTIVKRRSEEAVTAEDVKRVCRRNLESHEVPERVIFVDEFPRTSTGKIDRGSLRSEFG
ncbi:class I adenylate-forming enzyme family protein [Haloarchaeobius sp. TZWWS8]|uniref:class I adenylate-forming enzyme family protein n=1 Tax=Haloarchaeobius sp. TZWWS8 TaxID=3446121 RepID=UPI003EBF4DBE